MCVDGVTCDLCAGVVCPWCVVCGVLTVTERGELSELSPCPQQPWPITAHPRLSLVMLRCCGAQAAVGQLLLRPTTLRSEDLSRVSSSRPLTGSRDFNSCDMEKPTSYE